ncbi:DUF2637 domain-containing protein [Streptomyces sp. NPDC048479]|uniref:DUF2637 domain-containing protein n=1 Tax=Streptomyces sp. NPDC048479 TaxID=3154725 RepID=UPI00341DCFF5
MPTAGGAPHLPATANAVPELTRTHKILIGLVVVAVLVIATLGFIGSYAAVTELARRKGFGDFARAFPIAVDAGIIAFLALDLLLTWLRMPFAMLRHVAWGLTGATIAFNAATAWPDWIGVGMHGVIPVLFVIAVEAARHAVGRIADITADKHIDGIPLSRWIVAPLGSFRIWRRMRLWNIRSYDQVLILERQARIYRAQLRKEHGRAWRRKAGADQLLVLTLAKDGMSITEAIQLPEAEARKRAEAKYEAEVLQAEAEAKRRAEVARAEAAEAEAKAEAEVAAEVARLEVEAKRTAEAEAARLLVAETEAKLAAIAREQELAEAEANLKRRQQAAAATRLEQEQQLMAAEARAATARRTREESARAEAHRIASDAKQRIRTTSGSGSGPASGSGRTAAATSASGSAPRGKRQAEIEEVLTRISEAGDPEAVSLEWVMEHFDLKQTTAYDRLSVARDMWKSSKGQTQGSRS